MLNRAKAHNSQEVYMDALLKKQLEIAATKVRMGVIEGVHAAKAGHPGGSLSVADTLTYLYMHRMNVDPKNPTMPDRDRLVLSKGHTAPALYAVLAERGFFPVEELKTLRKIGSRLQGHPSMGKLPGIDMSTGSLGQGISTACGMALSGKISSDTYKVYTVLGDGEIEEGEVWEAFLFAAKYKLDNLCVIIDLNGLQIDGPTSEVMPTDPVDAKMRDFGFRTVTIDGHDFAQIEDAFQYFHTQTGAPTAVLMNTTKGKGVSYMENQVGWHGKAPNDEEYAIAMKELSDHLAQLEK